MQLHYEQYTQQEIEEISEIIETTFTDSEGEKEGSLIGKLTLDLLTTTERQDLYCFTAKEQEQIIGAVIFTPLKLEAKITAYILSPMAISPDYQGKGIGQALINTAIETLKADGVQLLITYGDPNYYGKVGFQQITEQTIKAPLPLSFPHGWLAQSLTAEPIPVVSGETHCVAALNKAEYW